MGKKKGEAETMEKFSELQYVRPDMEKVLGDMRAVTEALKNAADFGEFKAAYMDYVNTDIQVSTARQLAHIRNTINMMDEFYEAEMGYFHAWMPKYEILVREMGTVILNSPFKKDMEEEFFYVGLRLVQGVSLKEFEERFGERAQDVYPGLMERLEKEGAAVLSDGRFRLTDYGMDVSNYVMAEFLQ